MGSLFFFHQSLKTWKETRKLGISCGHLHAFHWNTELFGKVPEPLFNGFRASIESKLAAFEQEHGALTPIVTLKQSDVQVQVVGGYSFLVGWKVYVKALQAQQESKPKSRLAGLLSHLT